MVTIGDIAYGKGSDPVYWINKLNGDITFIRGNHDTTNKINFVDFTIIEASGLKFYLVHNPANVPHNWDGWIIHGRHHNNNITEFPFINRENKTINVSVELTDYKPVSLDSIINQIACGHPTLKDGVC